VAVGGSGLAVGELHPLDKKIKMQIKQQENKRAKSLVLYIVSIVGCPCLYLCNCVAYHSTHAQLVDNCKRVNIPCQDEWVVLYRFISFLMGQASESTLPTGQSKRFLRMA
jgi:hypothetical protein